MARRGSSLPFVSSQIPPDLRQFLERVRESLEGDTFVRRVDYLGGSVPRYTGDPPPIVPPPVPPPPPCGQPVAPTVPTGFKVEAGFTGFLLSWDMPSYCGHSHTEVYGLRRQGYSTELTYKNMLGESSGVFYSHVVTKPEDYWCFWARHVNRLGVESAFNALEGTCGKTSVRPDVIIDALTGQITESQLYRKLGSRINLIDAPGTGLIDTTRQLSSQYEELSQRISETSAGRGIYVYVQHTAPSDSRCLIAGIQHPEYATEPDCTGAGGIWTAGFLNADDLWYDYNDAAGAITLYRWNSSAWVTRKAVTAYKQTDAPTTGLRVFDLWHDTDAGTGVYYRWTGTTWGPLLDGYTEARIIDLEEAKIGYCVVGDPDGVVTDDNHDACLLAGGEWHAGLAWATAVKQVSVTTTPFCVLKGVVNKTSPYNTPTGCTGAGGTWHVGGTAAVEEEFQARQETDGALSAQYSVKIDNNGFISGFGLSSEPINGQPYSQFLIRADRFAVASPARSGDSNPVGVPVYDLVLLDAPTKYYALRSHSDFKLADGDYFSLSGVVSADSSWNDTLQVNTVTSTSDPWRFTFYSPNANTGVTFDASKAVVAKVSIPLIVTTTDTLVYGPLEAVVTATDVSSFTSGYGVAIRVTPTGLAQADSIVITLTDPISASSIAAAINACTTAVSSYSPTVVPLNACLYAAVNGARNKVTVLEADRETRPQASFRVRWNATTGYTDATAPLEMTIPPGVYIKDAFISKAVINWAQINTATIDWLTVVRQLRANSILAGDIDVGNCIGSAGFVYGSTGWRICGTGDAEFNNVTVRGAVEASTFMTTGVTGYTAGAAGMFVSKPGNFRLGSNNGIDGPRLRFLNDADAADRYLQLDIPYGGVATKVMYFGSTPASSLLQSVDFSAGSTGWIIRGDGSAEFGTLHLRSGSVSVHGYTENQANVSLPGVSVWDVGYGDYSLGNRVWYGTKGSLYWCTLAHTAAADKTPTNTTYWIPWSDAAPVPLWSASSTYSKGSRVWSSQNSVWVSRTDGNINHHPPASGNNDTYWARFTHSTVLATLACNMTNADAALGALFLGRFNASMLIDMAATSPLDRDVSSIDMDVKLVYYDDVARTVLATSGYYLPCVGKYDATYHLFQKNITDFTRVEGAKNGTVRLEAANYHGFSSVGITASSTALTFTGNKR